MVYNHGLFKCKGNIGEEERTVDSTKFEFCDEIMRRREREGGLGRVGGGGCVG